MTDRIVVVPWNANFEIDPSNLTGDHVQKADDGFIDNIKDNHLDDLFSYMVDAAIDFYKKLALDCSAQQVAVDLFMFNGQYADISSIGRCLWSI